MHRMRNGWYGYALAIYVKMTAVRGRKTLDLYLCDEMTR